MSEWIQKQDLYISCLQETHLRSKDTYKVRRWKDIPSKSKAGVAIHILDKVFYCYETRTLHHKGISPRRGYNMYAANTGST